MRKFGILVLAGAIAGCSFGADVPLAQKAVTTFHQQLDAGQFAESYKGASGEFRSATSEADWVKMADAVHRKLGKFQSTVSLGWNDQTTTSGHFIVLTYKSKYERGEANEQFTYRIEGAKALLAGYNVNSNALIMN